MSHLSPQQIRDHLFFGPPLAEQGVDVARALADLGQVHKPMRYAVAGAEPSASDALQAACGVPLPASLRAFHEAAGRSLGPLRIMDFRKPWDFVPESLVSTLEARTDDQREELRDAGQIPVACIGTCLSPGFYGDDVLFLLMEASTGWLFTEDYDRTERVYDGVSALLIEWGHRALDPRMNRWIGRTRSAFTPLPPNGLLAALRDVASGPPAEAAYVGGFLGLWRYRDSGVILRTTPSQHPEAWQTEVWLEAWASAGVDPQRTVAGGVLAEVVRRGLLPVG